MPQSSPGVNISENRLKQVLLNLILNASEAMPEGGKLEISLTGKDNRVEIAVSDTGGGIAPGELERVFEPFYSTRPTGCGLGLAISKRFVEESGGSISAANTPEGTVFTVSLPAAG